MLSESASPLCLRPFLRRSWWAGWLIVGGLLLGGGTQDLQAQGVWSALDIVREAAHRASSPIGALPVRGIARVGQATYGVTYRPSSARYLVEERAGFDLIYQQGYARTAREIGDVLAQTRAGTDTLVRGSSPGLRMPVVVDGFNDRSNGFVTPAPFKQEIEAPTIKRDALLSRSRSWPSLVATHELVHAAQAESDPGWGVGRVLRWFAPDATRALNLTAPLGLTEGIAVYRESAGEDGGGRLNQSLFRMKMRAAMLSDDPWEFTQMMAAPRFTQPFNRHYIGGAHAYEQLVEGDEGPGPEFFRDVTGNQNRLPVLGHGLWLWIDTGETPAEHGNDLREAFQLAFQAEVDALGALTNAHTVSGEVGLNHRRPYWLGDETLVAYVHGYATRPGFYRIDASTGRKTPIRIQGLTEDYSYSLSPDTSSILTGRYVADPFVETQSIAEIERVDLQTGAAERLTTGGRVLAPAAAAAEEGGETVWAIQNDGSQTQWARLDGTGSATPITAYENSRFRQIAPSPTDDRIALVLNVEGTQRIYRSRQTPDGPTKPAPWIGLEGAVIYDVSWGPNGRYLLFSADPRGIPNVFVFDTESGAVRQLTNVATGAFEPALSPDRRRLAFVHYQHERHDLATIPFEPAAAPRVADSLVPRSQTSSLHAQLSDRAAATDPAGSPPRQYAAWRYLAPRVVYPVLRDGDGDLDFDDPLSSPLVEDLGIGIGLGVSGADPLQRWTYDAQTSWQNGRPWGSVRIQTGRYRLRPSVFTYNQPDTRVAAFDDPQAGTPLLAQVGFEERGVGVGLELPVTLERNVYQSFLRAGVDGEMRQTRIFGGAVDAAEEATGRAIETGFNNRATLTPSLVFGYRLQQNARDLVPNTGAVLSGVAEVDAWTDGVPASRALAAEGRVYLPLGRQTHTGLEVAAGFVSQNRGSIFNLNTFVPRGYEDVGLPRGTFLRFGTEITQPLLYVDDGLSIIPLYLKALSAYGFGQTLGEVRGGTWNRRLSSVGAGLGLHLRLFYVLDVTFRVGGAYRFEAGDVEWITR